MPLFLSIFIIFAWLIVVVAIPLIYWVYFINPANKQRNLTQKHLLDSYFNCEYCLERIGISEEWAKAVIVFDRRTIQIYPTENKDELIHVISREQMQGFWQVTKVSQVWIDVEINQSLYLLKLAVQPHNLRGLLKSLRVLASREQSQAFAANIPYAPRFVSGSEVQQKITGEWERLKEHTLYLNPLQLVLLNSWWKIEKTVSLLDIQDIEAIPRMDEERTGILRFRSGEERFTLAIPDYEEWATALAEAASKAQGTGLDLEIMELKKKKDEEM